MAEHVQAYLLDVAGESELQLTGSQIPNLDGSVGRTCGEPVIARVHCH